MSGTPKRRGPRGPSGGKPKAKDRTGMEVVPCPTCRGTGKRGIRDCPLCEGSGKINARK
jgi:DnaJ-class molecular chaperone